MKRFVLGTALGIMILAGCEDIMGTSDPAAPAPTETAETVPAETPAQPKPLPVMTAEEIKAELTAVLKTQSKEAKQRYKARKPLQTLEFFEIQPGMTVVEALPGGGWYSKILIPFLGEDGTLIGGQYPDAMWAKFGFGEEWAAERAESSAAWASTAAEWGLEGAAIKSGDLTAMPEEAAGTVDAVLFIRALHNLSRFNDAETPFMEQAVAESFRVLKPGGIVGVVQHQAPEDAPDESTTGDRGYLKQSAVVRQFKKAGFEFVGAKGFNKNVKDNPGADQIVWRLPPSLSGTEEGTPEREAMLEIGESNRMTLKFKKPE